MHHTEKELARLALADAEKEYADAAAAFQAALEIERGAWEKLKAAKLRLLLADA